MSQKDLFTAITFLLLLLCQVQCLGDQTRIYSVNLEEDVVRLYRDLGKARRERDVTYTSRNATKSTQAGRRLLGMKP